jgi:ribosome maturation factor RimP
VQTATAARLEELTAPIAAVHGAYIIDIVVRGERTGKVVEVYLDADSGLSTDACAAVSRELADVLDREEAVQGAYHLVVSSPGIDRPLKYPRQYAQHVGRKIRVTHNAGGGRTSVEGILSAVTEDGVTVGAKGKEPVAIRFEEIVEAKVLPAW